MNHTQPYNWNTPQGLSWGAVLFLAISPIAAVILLTYYIWNYGIHWFDVTLLVTFFFLSNTAISAGYHRYYSHQSYECHWLLQFFYMVFGTIALQFSVIDWSRNHRIHHQYSDTELDPHNINQGFMHAHIFWVIHKTPLEKDFSNVKDLLKNKLCVWQKKYYWLIFTVVAVGLPTALGALVGRPWGGFLWGGLLRMVLQSHTTYSINSFAHTFGKRPFSIDSEARDSWILALLSNGEGFHNFHHRFASDYRNGWRWYHWDPTKWMVSVCNWIGLAWNLKKASDVEMLKAQLLVDSQIITRKLDQLNLDEGTRTTLEGKLHPVRRQLEKMAVQVSSLKQDLKQSAAQRRSDLEVTYRAQKQRLQHALREWKAVTRRAQRMKGEQVRIYVESVLNRLYAELSPNQAV